MRTGQAYINGKWTKANGEAFESFNPATGEAIWKGRSASPKDVDAAVNAARQTTHGWSTASLETRLQVVTAFREQLEKRCDQLIEAISRETGKPLWESATEFAAMIGKIPFSIEAYQLRSATVTKPLGQATGQTRFKAHGVIAVIGPFNFPGHVPNGHIVPALVAGNTVVFKPSELTPMVAELTVQCWVDAGAPPGVVNLIQGARETGAALIDHPELDGVYFTGGCRTGQAIHQSLLKYPHRIIALELGGNNPLVVDQVTDLDAAALTAVQSAFITAGQRCTCAGRLIVVENQHSEKFIEKLIAWIGRLRIGPYTDQPEPFMGPVISSAVADRMLSAQQELIKQGGRPLVEMTRLGEAMLSPGLIDVTDWRNPRDQELFGPLLRLTRVPDFDAAINEANRTAFGLSSGLLSDEVNHWEQFYRDTRAGVVNWNRPTTGATSAQPFGGVGLSGNHRPSGYFAADYCSYPVATVQSPTLNMPDKLPPGVNP